MASNSFLMYLLIILIIPTFINGSFFCYYQYQLYKLTKYSDTWRPWKLSTFGILGLVVGLAIVAVSTLSSFFIATPEIINVEEIYIPLFIFIYACLIACASGIGWAAFGLRKYWINVLELAKKA
ncbi:MAG: hypothetical protein ACTSO9_05380 [Candidatus Helarchaeota archaeon]